MPRDPVKHGCFCTPETLGAEWAMSGPVSDSQPDARAIPAADADRGRLANMRATTATRSQHEPVSRARDDTPTSENGRDERGGGPREQHACVHDARHPTADNQAARGSGQAFGLVILLLAVISYCVYSFLEQFSESIGVHPVVTGMYRWGGTVVVPALLGGAGCLLLVRILLARRRA